MKLNLNALHSMYNRTITKANKRHQAKEADYKDRKILNQRVNYFVLHGDIATKQAVNLIDKYVDLISIPNQSSRHAKLSVIKDKVKSQNSATVLLNLALYSKFGRLSNFVPTQNQDTLENVPTGIYYPLNHFNHQHGFELQTYRFLENFLNDYVNMNPDKIQSDDKLARYYACHTLEENYNQRKIDEDDAIVIQTKIISHSKLSAYSINTLKDRLAGYNIHPLNLNEAQQMVYLINHLTNKQINKLSLNKK